MTIMVMIWLDYHDINNDSVNENGNDNDDDEEVADDSMRFGGVRKCRWCVRSKFPLVEPTLIRQSSGGFQESVDSLIRGQARLL